MSLIRAAKDWRKRPTAMVMRDEWFGHRDPLTGKEQGDREEWVTWDFRLIQVFQLIEDFTDQHGFLAWEIDDPKNRTLVETTFEVDRAQQALNIAEKKKSNRDKLDKVEGSYLAPKLKRMNPGSEWPSHEEYFEYLAEKHKDD